MDMLYAPYISPFQARSEQQNRLPHESRRLLTKQGQTETEMLYVEKLSWHTLSPTGALATTATMSFHWCNRNGE